MQRVPPDRKRHRNRRARERPQHKVVEEWLLILSPSTLGPEIESGVDSFCCWPNRRQALLSWGCTHGKVARRDRVEVCVFCRAWQPAGWWTGLLATWLRMMPGVHQAVHSLRFFEDRTLCFLFILCRVFCEVMTNWRGSVCWRFFNKSSTKQRTKLENLALVSIRQPRGCVSRIAGFACWQDFSPYLCSVYKVLLFDLSGISWCSATIAHRWCCCLRETWTAAIRACGQGRKSGAVPPNFVVPRKKIVLNIK